jgi:hypothetical protein
MMAELPMFDGFYEGFLAIYSLIQCSSLKSSIVSRSVFKFHFQEFGKAVGGSKADGPQVLRQPTGIHILPVGATAHSVRTV